MSITPIEVDLCLWSQINASSDVASWSLTDADCLKDRVTMELPPRCSRPHSPKFSAFAAPTPIRQSTRAIYNGQTNSPTRRMVFCPSTFFWSFASSSICSRYFFQPSFRFYCLIVATASSHCRRRMPSAICQFNPATVEEDISLGSDNSTQYGAQSCAEKSIRLSHSAPEIGEFVHLTSAVVVRCPLPVFPRVPSLLIFL